MFTESGLFDVNKNGKPIGFKNFYSYKADKMSNIVLTCIPRVCSYGRKLFFKVIYSSGVLGNNISWTEIIYAAI